TAASCHVSPPSLHDALPIFDVIPARFDLDNRLSEAGLIGAVLRLSIALEGVDDEHDVTLIDCQPSLSHLTQLALAAAHHALAVRSEEHTSELQSRFDLVCRL